MVLWQLILFSVIPSPSRALKVELLLSKPHFRRRSQNGAQLAPVSGGVSGSISADWVPGRARKPKCNLRMLCRQEVRRFQVGPRWLHFRTISAGGFWGASPVECALGPSFPRTAFSVLLSPIPVSRVGRLHPHLLTVRTECCGIFPADGVDDLGDEFVHLFGGAADKVPGPADF